MLPCRQPAGPAHPLPRGNPAADPPVKHVIELLARGPSAEADRHPLAWSDTRRRALQETAAGLATAATIRYQLEAKLAQALLQCAEGRFGEAEAEILRLLGEAIHPCEIDDSIFIDFAEALFTVQRFDLLAALLGDRCGFARPVEIIARKGWPGPRRVGWEVAASGTHRFTVDAQAFAGDDTRLEILLFRWMFPLWSHYSRQPVQEPGTVAINLGDVGDVPGLAACDSRPDRFLVPDPIFVPSHGHRAVRADMAAAPVPWEARRPVAFWRGNTTGVPRTPGDWRSLERVRLCELAARPEHAEVFDAGLSGIVQFDDPGIAAAIGAAGLLRDFVPAPQWNRYKLQIDIDGNTNAWAGLLYRLLTGSPVLKVESSRGLMQWYYDRLIPWRNYVPVAPDLSDLADKARWLLHHDSAARAIGEAGRALADDMTFEREAERAMPVIAAAFRYFAGHRDGVGPYGRSA